MEISVWGARGSVPTPGPTTNGYGGNTSCVQVTLSDGTLLVLDAGSGIRALGLRLAAAVPTTPSTDALRKRAYDPARKRASIEARLV